MTKTQLNRSSGEEGEEEEKEKVEVEVEESLISHPPSLFFAIFKRGH